METENYVRSAKSANTIKAYQSDWNNFQSFCAERNLQSLPAGSGTLAAYAADSARRLKARTVERRLTAISQAHQLAGYLNPAEDKLVRTVMAGIRRVKGTVQAGKEPLSPDLLRKMFDNAAEDLRTLRDRAMLLVGFAGAFRRSELVALRVEDVRFTPGQTIGIPFGSHPESCPVRALEAWLGRSGITGGYLFTAIGRWGGEATAKPICDHQLAKIIKRLASKADLDHGSFSGHSLRSGLATSAAEGGASERSIMDQTRHRSLKQVRNYIRRGSLFRDNAAARSGL